MSFLIECDILKSKIFSVFYLQNEGEVYLVMGDGERGCGEPHS